MQNFTKFGRREMLAGGTLGLAATAASAALINGESASTTQLSSDALPDTTPDLTGAPYLSHAEAGLVGAVFDRLIPQDDLSIGAVEAGCVDFLQRQLAGDWGHAATRYRAGPFRPGTPEQGDQSPLTPRERYRTGLKAMALAVSKATAKAFGDLSADEQDDFLRAMEAGHHGDTLKSVFALMLQNVREGYFADPLYGGNKDMAGWALVGFPGARYDYRQEIDRPGADLGLAPVSLMGRTRVPGQAGGAA
ncbi:gluconate 2-dehydrogenase subunit 3 family protein [Novosphingobium profundi]|uniref:gluconate 2-dehydrogenase subunit 3 family protein n=1 Tax=Novosphingobium profundi TaxID=1774954 RepID=UPI001BDB5107|nr:gluconate 2-dehydrogenase subunit 3 family protein [Novosphingobium profundi]MBT0670645.1 gluconate 2-dehydrogenase subunit 3 family protein [Novosphingobium profundi]